MGKVYEYGVLAGYEKPERKAPMDIQHIKAKVTQVNNASSTNKKEKLVRQAKKRQIKLAKIAPFEDGNPEVLQYTKAKLASESNNLECPKSKSLKNTNSHIAITGTIR